MRINIYVDDDALASIDAAALAAGESRSGYLVRAALDLAAGASSPGLTERQRRAIATDLRRHVLEEMDV